MRAIRIILQLIFGLLSAMIIFVFMQVPNADNNSNIAMLVFFILIVFVLGPLWPSQENTERWIEKVQFPTDDIEVAKYVANFLGAAYGFYHVWEIYTNPTKELWRLEKTAFSIAGTNGVIIFWLVLSFACLFSGIKYYVKAR